jgi:hypothetical protein
MRMTRRGRTRGRTPEGEQRRDTPPSAGHPLVGSEVLDVIGSGGVPKRDMHDIIHAPDDEIVEVPLGPGQEAKVEFRPDPKVGDAGADMAEELGRSYLQSATSGEDMSEIENPPTMDVSEVGEPFLDLPEGDAVKGHEPPVPTGAPPMPSTRRAGPRRKPRTGQRAAPSKRIR